MTLVAVESIPKTKKVDYQYGRDYILDEFAASSARIVKVVRDSTDYVDNRSMYIVLQRFIRSQRRPMNIYLRNGEVYLEKIT